jgi:hypothetical protein
MPAPAFPGGDPFSSAPSLSVSLSKPADNEREKEKEKEKEKERRVSFSQPTASPASASVSLSHQMRDLSVSFVERERETLHRSRLLHLPLSLLRQSEDNRTLDIFYCDGEREKEGVSLETLRECHLQWPSWVLREKETSLSPSPSLSPSTALPVAMGTRPRASSPFIVAMYTNRSIAVYDVTSAVRASTKQGEKETEREGDGEGEKEGEREIVKLVSIPTTSSPVVFFTFLSLDLMVIVTHAEAFTWKLPSLSPSATTASAAATKPVKILQRVDLLDPKQ